MPAEAAGIRIDGRGVVLSALRRRGDELEIRVVAETREATRAVVAGPRPIRRARDVDLLGRNGVDVEPEADGALVVPLRPWEIRTIRIAFDPNAPRTSHRGSTRSQGKIARPM